MCYKGDGVISDSVLLPFLFWNAELRRVLPLYLFHCVRGSRWGWGVGFVSRSAKAYVVVPLIRNASSRSQGLVTIFHFP